jgi:hypothetical protein
MAAENSTAPQLQELAKLSGSNMPDMATTYLPFPATQCPLCGQDNRCAMEIKRATGVAQAPCWCLSETFPPDLIASLPTAAQGEACICIDCLRAHAQAITHSKGAA